MDSFHPRALNAYGTGRCSFATRGRSLLSTIGGSWKKSPHKTSWMPPHGRLRADDLIVALIVRAVWSSCWKSCASSIETSSMIRTLQRVQRSLLFFVLMMLAAKASGLP